MKYIVTILFVISCFTYKKKVPTGVIRIDDQNRIILISTGKASENAIQKDSISMKESTSREAAMLLLKIELSKKEYENIRNQFQIESIEFLENKEYCKITATYRNNN